MRDYPLKPGNLGRDCMQNGEHFNADGKQIECGCEKCDYYLCCINADCVCISCSEHACQYCVKAMRK